MKRDVLKQAALLHPEEIFPPFDVIMEKHGFEAVCTFAEQLGGFTIHVPVLRSIFSGCITKQLEAEFKGHNYNELSKKFGFTERHLRRMLGKP